MPDHFLLSPSAASRWLNCPGSLDLQESMPDRSSVYAEEGTLAHEYAARWLEDGTSDPAMSIEMQTHVAEYVAYCNTLRSGKPEAVVGIERKLESSFIEDFGGTIDFYVVDDKSIEIVDLKYGMGVTVDVEDNPQLLCYLLLLWEVFPEARKFAATIVQPRARNGDTIKRMEVSEDVLQTFRETVKDVQEESHFQAGDHCRWCPAVTGCDTLYQHTIEAAETDFESVASDPWEDRWLEILRLAPAIKKLLDAIPSRMLAEMQQGRYIEGYKAVMSLGNRCWALDDDAVIKKLASKKIGKRVTTTAKLKTPTQLAKEGYADEIEELVHRPERGHIVVPESDRREAIVFESPDNQFSDLSFLE